MYELEENGKEATPQHLQDMIDLAKAENIKVIFSQAEIDSKQPDAFAEEIGGEKIMLDPLSEDYIANLEHMAKAISGAVQ
jgi:zinc transport system substrate-binding protein